MADDNRNNVALDRFAEAGTGCFDEFCREYEENIDTDYNREDVNHIAELVLREGQSIHDLAAGMTIDNFGQQLGPDRALFTHAGVAVVKVPPPNAGIDDMHWFYRYGMEVLVFREDQDIANGALAQSFYIIDVAHDERHAAETLVALMTMAVRRQQKVAVVAVGVYDPYPFPLSPLQLQGVVEAAGTSTIGLDSFIITPQQQQVLASSEISLHLKSKLENDGNAFVNAPNFRLTGLTLTGTPARGFRLELTTTFPRLLTRVSESTTCKKMSLHGFVLDDDAFQVVLDWIRQEAVRSRTLQTVDLGDTTPEPNVVAHLNGDAQRGFIAAHQGQRHLSMRQFMDTMPPRAIPVARVLQMGMGMDPADAAAPHHASPLYELWYRAMVGYFSVYNGIVVVAPTGDRLFFRHPLVADPTLRFEELLVEILRDGDNDSGTAVGGAEDLHDSDDDIECSIS